MASGGVTRRGDSWRARYRHPDTGRQHQRSFRRQVDAQRWLRDQLAAVDEGRWVDPRAGRLTFGRYFASMAKDQVWTTNTLKAMTLAVESTPFVDVEIRRVTPAMCKAWVKAMSVGSGKATRPLAPGTIKTRVTNVRTVFKAAMVDKVIAVDPLADVKLPRLPKREASMRIPTPAEVSALLDVADERFVAFIALCTFAGLRLGEAAALQAQDVDFMRRRIHVQRQVQRGAEGIEIRPPKYESERWVPAPSGLLDILARHIELGHRGPWLFAGASDDPPHQNTVGYWWRQTCARAGVENVRLHDGRHFFASGLIASGCDVVTVQKALGHSKASVTLDTYSHLWPSGEDRAREGAAKLLEEVLGANVGTARAGGED